MTTKRTEERAAKVGKGSIGKGAGDSQVPPKDSKETAAAPAPAPVANVAVERQPPSRTKATPASKAPAAGAIPEAVEQGFSALRAEFRGLKEMVQKLTPARGTAGTKPRASAATDAALDGAMTSLRRLLSEVLADHLESVVKDLVDVRREAASLANGACGHIVERLDQTLENLGAIRFGAETMDVVDPLIHVVVEERHDDGVPDGVILATLRPGFRTGRGLVVSKAGVAVNRRS